MDAGSIKSRQSQGTLQARQITPIDQALRPQSNTIQSSSARDALLAVQAELSVALRTAKILAKEEPPLTEDEALETADRVAELLKASGSAFGSSAVLFQDLSPNRSKALLM